MSRYINFTTSASHKDSAFAEGNPLHDGDYPTKFLPVKAVKVDGVPLEFADHSLPERLHRTLIESQSFSRRSIVFDCLIFTALMYGVKIGNPGPDGKFVFTEKTEQRNVGTQDDTNSFPLNLGAIHGGADEVWYKHTVTPAHSVDGAQYIQKLGGRGAICISTLGAAKKIYRCTVAHPMTELQFGDQERYIVSDEIGVNSELTRSSD